MPVNNDVTFAPFQLDIEGAFSWILTHVMGYSASDLQSFYDTITGAWYVFSIISFIISAILLVAMIYARLRFMELWGVGEKELEDAERAFHLAHTAANEQSRWQRIVSHVSSDSPNDWRVAIVEADIMLEEMLDSLGYAGASIGDKLKEARPESFRSIEDAWDAHKVRNAIAHRGSDFVLTKRTAQETITKYQHVFEEFKFI